MNGNKVSQHQCAIHCFSVCAKLFGVFDNRQRGCKALVAAAGVDNNRHFAAVHSGVGACGCHGFCAHQNTVAVCVHQYFAYARAPVAGHTFAGNGNIVFNLTGNYSFNICNVNRLRKVVDVVYG